MEKTFTLQEFVEEFGTEKQKESFASGNGNLNSRTFTSIMNNAERYYAEYEVVGLGRKRQIRMYKKRAFILEKEDGRKSNGKWSNPYSLPLDLLILKRLEKGIDQKSDEPILYWCKFFGIINNIEYKILRSEYNHDFYRFFIKELKNKSIINDGEERVFRDFRAYYSKLKNDTLKSIERFSKIHALELTTFYIGILNKPYEILVDDDEYEEVKKISINLKVYEEVKEIEQKLKTKYSISDIEIRNLTKKKEVVAYKRERAELVSEVRDESGKILNLDFVYKTYQIYADWVDDLLQNYFENFKHLDHNFFLSESDEDEFWNINQVLFVEGWKEYIKISADKATEKFLEPKEIKDSSTGSSDEPRYRIPHIDDYKFNPEYFTLYFERKYSERMQALSNYFAK